jgi:metallophosphoesterase superfamily enzyme
MKLAKSLIKHLGAKKSGDNVSAVLEEQYKVKVKVSQLFIMPSFNQFLGGRPINEKKRQKRKREAFIGPILRSGCVNMDEAEVYLLDGTFLGTVAQLKALS